MKSKCCQKGYDFEKLDQKLDIMLAYTGDKTINRVSNWLDKLICLIKGHRYWEIDCILVCSRCGKKEV